MTLIGELIEYQSARTKILATNLLSPVELTDNDIEVVRYRVPDVKVKICEGNSKANIFPRKGHEVPKEE
jgi:hypothetical protein